jgi:hypothetical protein
MKNKILMLCIGLMSLLLLSACGLEKKFGIAKSTDISTDHFWAINNGVGELKITCKKSSSDVCHYVVWNVVGDTIVKGQKQIFQNEQTFKLKLNETKVISPAEKGSAFCHDSSKMPDAKSCQRISV